jgi:hypothetical protein
MDLVKIQVALLAAHPPDKSKPRCADFQFVPGSREILLDI